MNPRVSICIPTYNYARYLPLAIESVLKQSFTDYELIIIDDRSTDNTKKIVAEYASRDPRITFKVNQYNLGMVENWNLCLRESRGEYIKYLFADDLFSSKDAVKRMVEVLDADSTVSLVASARNVIDADGAIVDVWSHFDDGYVEEGTSVIRHLVGLQQNLVGEPTAVMFRKGQATRGYNTRYRQLVDLEFWFCIMEQGKFAYIAEPLVAFRIHPEQQTAVNIRNNVHINDLRQLTLDYLFNKKKNYLNIHWLKRNYIIYNYHYQIWKEYKKKKILEKDVALKMIADSYDLRQFFLLYPIYKIVKPILKLIRSLGSSPKP